MTVERLIAKLTPLAEINPEMKILIARGGEGWFDELEGVETCRIDKDHDGLRCGGPHESNEEGDEEVIVIH